MIFDFLLALKIVNENEGDMKLESKIIWKYFVQAIVVSSIPNSFDSCPSLRACKSCTFFKIRCK